MSQLITEQLNCAVMELSNMEKSVMMDEKTMILLQMPAELIAKQTDAVIKSGMPTKNATESPGAQKSVKWTKGDFVRTKISGECAVVTDNPPLDFHKLVQLLEL